MFRKNRKIAALFLIVVFLTATVGITTYKHICATEGVITSLFIPSTHDCEEHHQDEILCCAADESLFKDNCCEDEITSYKVQSEFNQEKQQEINYTSILVMPIKWLFQVLVDFLPINTTKSKTLAFVIEPPYLSGGLEYLQKIQVWRL